MWCSGDAVGEDGVKDAFDPFTTNVILAYARIPLLKHTSEKFWLSPK